MKALIAFVLATALVTGCAATQQPAQQEALVSIAIAVAIEKSKDPAATARIVLQVANADVTADTIPDEVKARIGYNELHVSQQFAVEVVLDELNRQLAAGITAADKDETVAMWRRAAIAAASKF